MGEITVCASRDFDEVRDEPLVLTIGFGHTALPGDYRSKAKVEAEKAANDALLKENAQWGGVAIVHDSGGASGSYARPDSDSKGISISK